MYALTKEAGELEANEWFRNYLKGKRKEEIYADFNEALMAVKKNLCPTGIANLPRVIKF